MIQFSPFVPAIRYHLTLHHLYLFAGATSGGLQSNRRTARASSASGRDKRRRDRRYIDRT